MASPAVQTRSTTTANAPTITVTLPASSADGDLIFIHLCANSVSTTWSLNAGSSGWTEIYDDNGEAGYWKQIGASESNPVFDPSVNERTGASALRITGHENPATQAPEVSASPNTGTSTAPNPSSVTPTGGSKDYLFIATAGHDDARSTFSAAPTNYSNLNAFSGGGGASGCTGATAERQLTASSDDPGAFTTGRSEPWAARTVVIHPVAAAEVLVVDGGTYAITGATGAEEVDFTFNLPIDSGTYSVTGANVDFTFDLPVAGDTYAITGATADFTFNLPIDSGTYSITGANMTPNFPVTVDSGTYTVTGTDADFTFNLPIDSGTYTITGDPNALLEYHQILDVAGGTYVITGTDATLRKGFILAADSDTYAITGATADLDYHVVLDIGSGTYVITGANVDFTFNLPIDSGTYAVTGANVDFTFVLPIASGTYTITGATATFTFSLSVASGSYVITGTDATLGAPAAVIPGMRISEIGYIDQEISKTGNI